MSAQRLAGVAAWLTFERERFAREPKNPHAKNSGEHSEWATGFSAAMIVFFLR